MEHSNIDSAIANPKESLREILEHWISTLKNDLATLKDEKEIYSVTPKNRNSANVRLWVSDDARHIGFSVGRYSWWADHALLTKDAITPILSAIAIGNFTESSRYIGRKVLATKGVLTLESGYTYTYGQINPLSLIPNYIWPWQRHSYEAYDANA